MTQPRGGILETLLFESDNGLATVTLNRPDEANAMNLTMMREFMEVSIRCDEDPAIRCLLITGSGRMFSAGGDLKSFMAADDTGALLKEMTVYFHAAISRMARMDAPVVIAVNGTAAGAGFSLAASGDITLAAESARFVSAYTAGGLSPDGSSTFFVPRLLGWRRAMELMLTNRSLTAAEAAEWGLINRAVPDGELMSEATSLARKLASGPTVAYGKVKQMLQSSFSATLETQMEFEARNIADLTRTDDLDEGIEAFVEKRTPEFKGR